MDENKLEEAVAETVEQSFNDSELEDIMSEIENLEKEFVEDVETSAEDLSLTESTSSELQEVIDKEVESISNEMNTIEETATSKSEVNSEEVKSSSVVLSLPISEKKPSNGSNMDFSASGSMDLNLNFKIGNETATLKVDANKGLIVEMGGVEIQITESEGCTVTMEGGVNFNIPLTTSGKSSKKKAA